MMIPSIRRFMQCAGMALVLCLAGCASTAATHPAPSYGDHPALWSAHDADTTVYLFGTVHVVKKDAQWHFPALDKALAASKVLYIEATDANKATLRPLIMQYGLDLAHPLSTKISKQENALLQQVAKQMGMPQRALEMMKPWLAGISIAAAPLLKAGYDPKLGVDKQLQAQFKQAGKPVKGLESAKQQVLMLANLPKPLQLALLRQSLHEYKHADTQLAAILGAWKHGDVEKLAQVVDLQMKQDSPQLYQTLIVKRNGTWAGQIAKLMQSTPGTIFIAVGTGHLVGPDRVQVQLTKLGVTAARVSD